VRAPTACAASRSATGPYEISGLTDADGVAADAAGLKPLIAAALDALGRARRLSRQGFGVGKLRAA